MHIYPTSKPQIFLSMGDPAGVGPEIIAKSLLISEIRRKAVFTIVGDKGVVERAFSLFPKTLARDVINIVDPGPSLKNVTPGRPTDAGARKALRCLEASIDLIQSVKKALPKALVTAPVSKERINRIYPGFRGHTEYLQEAYSSKLTVMVMIGKSLCVVPVTRHIPLRDVAKSLNIELISKTLREVSKYRRLIMGKDNVRIGVCALNPHAGEGGIIGDEEERIIAPAIEKARRFYKNIEGPISADTIFYKATRRRIDVVVAMYHDQCLGPFKMVDFECGVNMTLGLGDIRTSPDHGTAFDIAGKGIASSRSMEQAIKLAVRAATIYKS